MPDGLSFACPRCRRAVDERFYGPCTACRGELRLQGGVQRDVAVAAYEPKMNVAPNQVATKE